MRKIVLLIALVITATLNAKEYKINSAEQLGKLTLAAGDVVLFQAGRYSDQALMLKGDGTQQQPIILKAERVGDVVFGGGSTLRFDGKFLQVHNLVFEDIAQKEGLHVVDFSSGKRTSSDCRLYNSIIRVKELGQSKEQSTWVVMSGFRNVVERCSFDNKKNMQPILIVTFEKNGPAPGHKIINNYFRRENSNADESKSAAKDDDEGADAGRSNGQETIRIGTGPFSQQQGNCLVENNLFYRCNGEAEVISNKTRANTYRNNLFLECKGALTLRQGGDCLVEQNYFIGNGIEDTGGIRVAGDRHTIRNNYFEGGMGDKYFAAICLIKGMWQKDPNKPIPVYHYAPVDSVLIERNTIVNCKTGFNICFGVSQPQTLPVVNTTIKENVICNDNSTNVDIICYEKPVCDIRWVDNTVYGGRYIGVTPKQIPMTKSRPAIAKVKDKIEYIKSNSGAVK